MEERKCRKAPDTARTKREVQEGGTLPPLRGACQCPPWPLRRRASLRRLATSAASCPSAATSRAAW
eukprot:1948226-Alexandrium_andersonii.AAC.1